MGKDNLKIMTHLDILTACCWIIWDITIITGSLTKPIHKLKHNDTFLTSQDPLFKPTVFNVLLSKI